MGGNYKTAVMSSHLGKALHLTTVLPLIVARAVHEVL